MWLPEPGAVFLKTPANWVQRYSESSYHSGCGTFAQWSTLVFTNVVAGNSNDALGITTGVWAKLAQPAAIHRSAAGKRAEMERWALIEPLSGARAGPRARRH